MFSRSCLTLVLALTAALAPTTPALADASSETVTAATHAELAAGAADLNGVHTHPGCVEIGVGRDGRPRWPGKQIGKDAVRESRGLRGRHGPRLRLH